ncbi:GNAT family N-acetyltransferase [Halomonas sp. Bachu 37]|uniref:GNAT family N-acetyltransferase n=1 Tax=Halomonas kashgarensis TaxID=3084920 RepID=UPI003216C261
MEPQTFSYTAETGSRIVTCPVPWRRKALMQLAAAQTAQSDADVAAIEQLLEREDVDWRGLLITPDESEPNGAVWVEVLPGKEANLWLPQPGCSNAPDLLSAAIYWARGQGIRLVKTVLEVGEHSTAALLTANGFPAVVCLHYLSAPAQAEENSPVAGSRATFTHVSEITFEHFAALFERVEEGSKDCPELQGTFTAQEALMGFQRQDAHAPAQWYLVRCEGEDAGVLLLAPHPEAGNWELMYMGLVPAWRGRGLGRQVVNEALRRAAKAGVDEVLLAVDERNTPARQLYEQAGFKVQASCVVHAWIDASATAANPSPGGAGLLP